MEYWVLGKLYIHIIIFQLIKISCYNATFLNKPQIIFVTICFSMIRMFGPQCINSNYVKFLHEGHTSIYPGNQSDAFYSTCRWFKAQAYIQHKQTKPKNVFKIQEL